jgi:predicted pyridoxine 5'-phosphate oxidase superfamily flavin-nucleotide-binding protein
MAEFHDGELRVQRAVGDEHAAAKLRSMIADRLPAGADEYFAAHPLAIGATAVGGQPWAWPLFGPFGAPDEHTVSIGDPGRMEHDGRLGLLFIHLGVRRRFRVNGTFDGRALHVEEAYPNCPKYISKRALRVTADLPRGDDVTGVALDEAARELLTRTDALFVASANPGGGLDASHRGGNPGFVEVLDDRTVRIPDYTGNGMFNTLGNLVVEPRAGLLVLDLEAGAALQVAGTTTVDLGPERSWTLAVSEWRRWPLGVHIASGPVERSRFNP